MISARQLTDHERVKPIRLTARNTKPCASGRDLIGMQRQHPQPRIQQPLHEQPVRSLDRDQLHLQPHQRAAQCPQPRLIMRECGSQKLPARLVAHHHVVLLRRPINAGVIAHHKSSCGQTLLDNAPTRRYRCGRSQTGPQPGLRPVAARGTSPPPRGAGLLQALHRASSLGPLPAAVETTTGWPMSSREPVAGSGDNGEVRLPPSQTAEIVPKQKRRDCAALASGISKSGGLVTAGSARTGGCERLCAPASSGRRIGDRAALSWGDRPHSWRAAFVSGAPRCRAAGIACSTGDVGIRLNPFAGRSLTHGCLAAENPLGCRNQC